MAERERASTCCRQLPAFKSIGYSRQTVRAHRVCSLRDDRELGSQQYDFRKGRNDLDVLSAVVNIARNALKADRWLGGNRQAGREERPQHSKMACNIRRNAKNI